QGEAPGAEVAYNWIHDIIKYGIRFDAPIGQVGTGQNGTMHHNVIWNAAGGLMVKGDYHDIHNNTVFNSTLDKNDMIILTDGGINNKNSTIHYNAVDSMADHRSDDVFDNPLPNGIDWMNWNGYVQGQQDKMTAGTGHSCSLYSNSSVYCWGSNFLGALGDASTAGDSNVHEPGWVDLGVGRTATSIAHGGVASYHGCAILDNNSLSCWGWNGQGQLGLGNTTNQGAATFVDLGTGRSPIKVTLGQLHTCVLLDNNSVYCMGDNTYGQVGDGTTVDKNSPTFVDFGNGRYAVDIESGDVHTCALLDNGSVSCWGYNAYGQLGLGHTTTPVSVPTYVPLALGRHVASLATGQHHTCFAYDNGDVACTGRNQQGQLGIGNTAQKTTLTATQSLGNPALKVVAGSYFSCALLNNGSVRCWGDNGYGQLGINTNIDSTSPAASVQFESGSYAIDVISGLEHLCARLSNGSMTCWGRNHVGQLGIGNILNQDEPVVLENISSLHSTTLREMLVDPDNDDFRPKWGSHLHILKAGAYDAGDTDPWTAGVSWTYSPMSDPISGCMDSIAINYNSNAVFADGSCSYTTLSTSSSSFSLEVGVTMTPHTLDYTTPFLADGKQTAASSGAVGMGTNMALDSNGAVHICSEIESSDDLYYTTNASGSWDSATIDSGGNIGGDCFIILDSDDDIHITYYDDTNNVLKYATKALSSAIAAINWDVSTLDNNGDVGNFGSMAVDDDDTLHVAYYRTTGSSLKYATLVDGGSSWSIETVESTNNIGKFTSIALDSNGKPHITYRDVTNTNLRYAHKMGSSWVTATIDSTSLSGSGTSLAIDSNDHLHVAYKTNSTEMAYMTNRSGSWVKTTLDANTSGSWGVSYVDIMLDEGDDPHVVYSDMVDNDVFYMSNTRGVWERVLVAGDSISKSSSATMDSNGGIHVAYYIDGSFDDVGYAAVRSLAHVPIFEIEPALPTGLSLDSGTGVLSGTPLQPLTSTVFTVWANTTRTSAMTTLSIDVDWAVNLDLIPNADGRTLTINQAMSTIEFSRPTPDYTASDIATSAEGAYSVYAADMDDDGDLDIVSASGIDDTIAWYENDGAANPSWTATDIATTADNARSVFVADMDGDGDLDIVSASCEDDTIAWYESDGASNPSWT
ncbi:MAG: hypothetical protein HOM38_04860, partial [Euryarchaeota archaeon]|nr:hypothetical protein [Euryarchaeota archaeon]